MTSYAAIRTSKAKGRRTVLWAFPVQGTITAPWNGKKGNTSDDQIPLLPQGEVLKGELVVAAAQEREEPEHARG